MLFNAQFGTGVEASAYVAAFRLPETLLNLLGGGTLAAAMIPVLLRTRHEDGDEVERQLVALTLAVTCAVMLAASVLGIALAGPFVRTVLAPGFDAETTALTITLTRLMLLEPPLLLLSTVAMAVVSSRNQFFLVALSIAVHNVVLIGGLLVARLFPAVGIYGPATGVVLDGVLQASILLPGLRANGFHVNMVPTKVRRLKGFLDPSRLRDFVANSSAFGRLRELVRLVIPGGLSAIVNYGGTIVDTAAASFAREAGALPAIHNAFLLIGLPIRLLGQAVAQAVYPHIAAHAAAREWAAMRRLLLRALAITVGLALPAMAALIGLGRWIIWLLFERGAFSAAAGDLTYTALAAYALGLPFYIATELLARGHAALYDTTTPLLTNLLQLACRVALIWLLLPALGAVAIPLAFAASSALEAGVLALILWRRLSLRYKPSLLVP
ncbi:MAG: murein biosynthesis integral membrane protein MurJ [Roseiflexaceae bacterium]|nr:murein biosynthesis integral membrane protein MurJ [Roseiflexaceae bacterium]